MSTPESPQGLALRIARDGEILANLSAQADERERIMSRALHSIWCSLRGEEWDGNILPDDVTPMRVADEVLRKTNVLRSFVTEFGGGGDD